MPKAPEQMRRVIEVMKTAPEPMSSVEVAERVGTSRQNAYNIIKGRLVPVGLARVVGRSETLAELYAWDAEVEKKGVEPAARTRGAGTRTQGRTRNPSPPIDSRGDSSTHSGGSRATRGSDGGGGSETHDLKRSDASRRASDTPTHRARVKVDEGGHVEVLEVEGITKEELLGFWQPFVGKQIEVQELRIVAGGVVEMDVVVDGHSQTVELQTVA